MKWGKELLSKQNPRFRGHYIAYDDLKAILKRCKQKEDGAAKSPPERGLAAATSAAFIAALQKEIVRIDSFVTAVQAQLDAERQRVDAFRRASRSVPDAIRKAVERERELWHILSALREFVELNYTGFYKITKKHDKMTGIHLLDIVLEVVDAQPFMAVLDGGVGAATGHHHAAGADGAPSKTQVQAGHAEAAAAVVGGPPLGDVPATPSPGTGPLPWASAAVHMPVTPAVLQALLSSSSSAAPAAGAASLGGASTVSTGGSGGADASGSSPPTGPRLAVPALKPSTSSQRLAHDHLAAGCVPAELPRLHIAGGHPHAHAGSSSGRRASASGGSAAAFADVAGTDDDGRDMRGAGGDGTRSTSSHSADAGIDGGGTTPTGHGSHHYMDGDDVGDDEAAAGGHSVGMKAGAVMRAALQRHFVSQQRTQRSSTSSTGPLGGPLGAEHADGSTTDEGDAMGGGSTDGEMPAADGDIRGVGYASTLRTELSPEPTIGGARAGAITDELPFHGRAPSADSVDGAAGDDQPPPHRYTGSGGVLAHALSTSTDGSPDVEVAAVGGFTAASLGVESPLDTDMTPLVMMPPGDGTVTAGALHPPASPLGLPPHVDADAAHGGTDVPHLSTASDARLLTGLDSTALAPLLSMLPTSAGGRRPSRTGATGSADGRGVSPAAVGPPRGGTPAAASDDASPAEHPGNFDTVTARNIAQWLQASLRHVPHNGAAGHDSSAGLPAGSPGDDAATGIVGDDQDLARVIIERATAPTPPDTAYVPDDADHGGLHHDHDGIHGDSHGALETAAGSPGGHDAASASSAATPASVVCVSPPREPGTDAAGAGKRPPAVASPRGNSRASMVHQPSASSSSAASGAAGRHRSVFDIFGAQPATSAGAAAGGSAPGDVSTRAHSLSSEASSPTGSSRGAFGRVGDSATARSSDDVQALRHKHVGGEEMSPAAVARMAGLLHHDAVFAQQLHTAQPDVGFMFFPPHPLKPRFRPGNDARAAARTAMFAHEAAAGGDAEEALYSQGASRSSGAQSTAAASTAGTVATPTAAPDGSQPVVTPPAAAGTSSTSSVQRPAAVSATGAAADGRQSHAADALWSSGDPRILATMRSQFEAGIKHCYRFADGALLVMSPELKRSDAEAERLKRLARVGLVIVNAQARVADVVSRAETRHKGGNGTSTDSAGHDSDHRAALGGSSGRVTVRSLHDYVLANKLEVFRAILSTLIREVELTYPEGAAALELLSQAHYVLFAQYMSSRSKAPDSRRTQLLQALGGNKANMMGMASPLPAPSMAQFGATATSSRRGRGPGARFSGNERGGKVGQSPPGARQSAAAGKSLSGASRPSASAGHSSDTSSVISSADDDGSHLRDRVDGAASVMTLPSDTSHISEDDELASDGDSGESEGAEAVHGSARSAPTSQPPAATIPVPAAARAGGGFGSGPGEPAMLRSESASSTRRFDPRAAIDRFDSRLSLSDAAAEGSRPPHDDSAAAARRAGGTGTTGGATGADARLASAGSSFFSPPTFVAVPVDEEGEDGSAADDAAAHGGSKAARAGASGTGVPRTGTSAERRPHSSSISSLSGGDLVGLPLESPNIAGGAPSSVWEGANVLSHGRSLPASLRPAASANGAAPPKPVARPPLPPGPGGGAHGPPTGATSKLRTSSASVETLLKTPFTQPVEYRGAPTATPVAGVATASSTAAGPMPAHGATAPPSGSTSATLGTSQAAIATSRPRSGTQMLLAETAALVTAENARREMEHKIATAASTAKPVAGAPAAGAQPAAPVAVHAALEAVRTESAGSARPRRSGRRQHHRSSSGSHRGVDALAREELHHHRSASPAGLRLHSSGQSSSSSLHHRSQGARHVRDLAASGLAAADAHEQRDYGTLIAAAAAMSTANTSSNRDMARQGSTSSSLGSSGGGGKGSSLEMVMHHSATTTGMAGMHRRSSLTKTRSLPSAPDGSGMASSSTASHAAPASGSSAGTAGAHAAGTGPSTTPSGTPAAAQHVSAFGVARHILQDIRADVITSWPKWKHNLAVAIGIEEEDAFGSTPDHYGAGAGGALAGTPGGGGGGSQKPVIRRLWEKWRPACMEWMPQYNWRKNLMQDVIAGVTIGVVLIPQGLAYATLAGLPPVYGVYTGFPSLIYALFGTSRHAAIGPMSLPALLMATAVSDLNPAPKSPEEYIGEIMALTFLCGFILFLMGLLNMGFIVRFISQPVLSGFTSAAAVMTIVSVFKDLLGSFVPRSQVLQDYVVGIVKAIPGTHVPTFIVGVVGLLLLNYLPRVQRLKRVPAALLVVIASIIVFAIFMLATKDSGGEAGAYATQQGIALVGAVPSSFPVPKLPPLSRAVELLPTAFGLIVVGYVESIAVSKLYAVKYGYEINPSSELKALGLTNMGGAVCFQSFLVMGAFGRSAVNDSSGARSQMSGVIATGVVVALLLFIMPALFYLPKAILAAMIIMAVRTLIKFSDVPRLWKVDKRDLLNMLAAFLSTLFLGVLPGIVLSMAFSLVLFIYASTNPQIQEMGRVEGTVIYRELGLVGVYRVPEVKILGFIAPVMFFNCSVLKDRLIQELLARKKMPPRLQWKALIISFASVSNIDSTSIQVLEEVVAETIAQRVPFIIAGASWYVEQFLKSSGFVDKLGGPSFMYSRVHQAVRAVLMNEISPSMLPAAPVKAGAAAAGGAATTGTGAPLALMDAPAAAAAAGAAAAGGAGAAGAASSGHGSGSGSGDSGTGSAGMHLPGAPVVRDGLQRLTHLVDHLTAVAQRSGVPTRISVHVVDGTGGGTGSGNESTSSSGGRGGGGGGGSGSGGSADARPSPLMIRGGTRSSLASQQVTPDVQWMHQPLVAPAAAPAPAAASGSGGGVAAGKEQGQQAAGARRQPQAAASVAGGSGQR